MANQRELHIRSHLMRLANQKAGFQIREVKQDNQCAQYATIANHVHRIVDGHVSEFTGEKLVYMGSHHEREVILFDPNKQFFQDKYAALKALIKKREATQIEAIIALAIEFVRNKDNFNIADDDNNTTLEDNIEQFIKQSHFAQLNGHTIIQLEDFLNAHLGVCRHHALYLAYLLDHLQHDRVLPSGKIILRRDNVGKGAHIWVLYQPDASDRIYLADSLWNQRAYEFNRDFGYLRMNYGERAVNNMRQVFVEKKVAQEQLIKQAAPPARAVQATTPTTDNLAAGSYNRPIREIAKHTTAITNILKHYAIDPTSRDQISCIYTPTKIGVKFIVRLPEEIVKQVRLCLPVALRKQFIYDKVNQCIIMDNRETINFLDSPQGIELIATIAAEEQLAKEESCDLSLEFCSMITQEVNRISEQFILYNQVLKQHKIEALNRLKEMLRYQPNSKLAGIIQYWKNQTARSNQDDKNNYNLIAMPGRFFSGSATISTVIDKMESIAKSAATDFRSSLRR